jgi:DNA-binding Lrp family transcriptional regulator
MKQRPDLKEVDFKIIRELQMDARKSFTDIARELGVSVNFVSYRFKRLRESGIIKGSTLILNFKRIPQYQVFVFLTTACGREEEVADYIKHEMLLPLDNYLSEAHAVGSSKKEVGIVACQRKVIGTGFIVTSGSSIEGILYGLKKEEVEAVVKRMEELPHVLQVNTALITDYEELPERVNIWTHSLRLDDLHSGLIRAGDMIYIDKLDIKILQNLVEDSMISFSELANRLKVSADSVARRYDKMVKSGLINKASIILDAAHFGFFGYVGYIIAVRDHSSLDSVKSQLLKLPNIYTLASFKMDTFPNYSFYASLFVERFEDIITIQQRISKIPSIKKVLYRVLTPQDWFEIPSREYYKIEVEILDRQYAGVRKTSSRKIN